MKELREPSSLTAISEKRIRRKLEAKYGPILDEATAAAIAAREVEQARKRHLSVEKARLKLLRVKEIVKLRQSVRRACMKEMEDCPPDSRSSNQKSSTEPPKSGLIEVEY